MSSEKLVVAFKKELYPKEALIKAAYSFIDRCYIYLDHSDTEYIVELKPKDHDAQTSHEDGFKNELLAQTVRLQVYKQTHVIREILMARAMATTLIVEAPPAETNEDTDLSEILLDWFDKHGEK
jgi:His-Xaa-Ser system protein HxsD